MFERVKLKGHYVDMETQKWATGASKKIKISFVSCSLIQKVELSIIYSIYAFKSFLFTLDDYGL